MQKKIIALAIAAAFSAPVVAMADVNFYGTMDGGFRHQTNDAPAQGTTDTMQVGQYNTARWGFKSVEDMGDGLKTNVVLETSYFPGGIGANTDTNTSTTAAQSTAQANPSNPFGLIFDRQATIGLEGGWGKFDMGWNYTTSFSVIKTYDPFDYKFLGVAGAKTSDLMRLDAAGVAKNQDRAGNVTYQNKFGDVTVMLEYDINNGTKTAQPQGGTGRALGVTYASGPINVGFAYTAVEADKAAGFDNATTHMTAGAGYNFGDGKVSIGYAKNTIKSGSPSVNPLISEDTSTNMWAGVSYNVTSKVGVTAAYYANKKVALLTATGNESTKNTVMVGVTYALSKKTALYVEMDRAVSKSDSATAIDATTIGTSAGLSTAF